MLDGTLFERNCPVRVVVTHWRRYQEAARQLGVHNHLSAGVQLFHEVSLNAGIRDHVVVDVPLELVTGLAEVLLGLTCGEDVDIELVLDRVVG